MTKISNSFADLLDEQNTKGGTGFERVSRLLNVYKRTFREFHHFHVLDAQFNIVFDTEYPDTPYLDEYFKANSRVLDIFISVIQAGISDRSVNISFKGDRNIAERASHMFLNVLNSYVEKLSLRKQLMEAEQQIPLENELDDFIDYLIQSLH